MATIFFSYSHKDEALRNELEVHLAMLKREGTIETWHDRRIPVGDEFDHAIDKNMEHASVILLLVSPDFLASSYCYDIEVQRAMERHETRSVRVIPVILRPCDWKHGTFAKLLAAPRDGKPVTTWPNKDEAFLDVVQQIRSVLPNPPDGEPAEVKFSLTATSAVPPQSIPRSSNLRLKKEFSDADKDRFLEEAFEFIALYFQNSLSELQERNDGIETRFKRLDAEAFSAIVYKGGSLAVQCGIRKGGNRSAGGGITLAYDATAPRNSFNESLDLTAGDQSLYLSPLGIFMTPHIKHLTPEGAAEYYWAKFIERLQ